MAQGSVLKAELSASQLERTRLEGELSGLRGTNQSLDLSNARLTSQYQVTRAKHAQKRSHTPAGAHTCFCARSAGKTGFRASQSHALST